MNQQQRAKYPSKHLNNYGFDIQLHGSRGSHTLLMSSYQHKAPYPSFWIRSQHPHHKLSMEDNKDHEA